MFIIQWGVKIKNLQGRGGIGVTDVVYKLENLFTSMGSFHFSRSYESVLMVDYFAQPNNLIKNTTVRMGK